MGAAGEFRHHALGVHAAGEHVAVVAIAGDHLVAGFQRHLHADHHGLLADIEVAEAPDQAHAVHLPRLFLEPADGQHAPVGGKLLVLAEVGDRGGRLFGIGARAFLGDRHWHSLRKRPGNYDGGFGLAR